MMGDFDSQFESAIHALQDNWAARTSELSRDITKLRASNDNNLRQINSYQQEISDIRSHNMSLNDALKNKEDENISLRADKQALQEQVDSLEKKIQSLNAFKSAILSLVDGGGGGAFLASAVTELQSSPAFSRSSPASRNRSPARRSVSIRSPHSSPSLTERVLFPNSPLHSIPSVGSMNSGSLNSSMSSSSLVSSVTGLSSGASGMFALDTPVDAANFYRQVRGQLDPTEFKQFATNIKSLNSGIQSVDTTLANVRIIFGPNRPFLFSQLQKLVRQAETI